MADREKPSTLVRVVAAQFWTLVVGGLLAAALVGWIILDTVRAEQPVPPYLIVLCGVGVALAALAGIVYARSADAVQTVWSHGRAEKDAAAMLREVRRVQKRHLGRLPEAEKKALAATSAELADAAARHDHERIAVLLNTLDKQLDDHLSFARKSTAREYVESIAVAVLIALFLRSFVVEAFRIPSGSMIPTLQVGDHIFVNKFIYGVRIPYTDIKLGMGVRAPERGEVIVFKYPKEPDKDFIKRIVGVGGDTVEIRQNVVFLNGHAIEHVPIGDRPCEYDDKEGGDEESTRWQHHVCEAFAERLDGRPFTAIYNNDGAQHSWPPVTVPQGSVFVMGDNRDNSHDSRFWGFVPFELIKGKAMVIWWSSGVPEGIRFERMGHFVK